MADGARDDDTPGQVPTDDLATDGLDPDDFARRVRAFGFEAHQLLARPDSSVPDLMALHWRAWSLLHEAPGEQAPEVDRWVLVTRRAIVARLNDWAAEEFESGAA